VLTINFYLFRIVPGDPISMIVSPRMRPETRDRIRESYGLDKPIWFNVEALKETDSMPALFDSQYFRYLANLAQGDLGVSFRQKRDVSELIAGRLGPTLLLMFTGEVAGILIGTVMGIVAAWKARSWIDAGSLGIGLTMFALPAFWLGIVLLILTRGILPAGGYVTLGVQFDSTLDRWLDIAKHLVLPATTMALLLFGAYMLVVRNSTLEVLAEDYILTAKAKGFKQISILRSHALKNAALPLVTIIALDLGIALGGMIQIETIFSWPGLGRLMFDAIGQRDYPVLQGVFLLLAIGVILANFLADLTYVYLDPRVKA
jgi:peptide/nickel transport system permease protein